MNLLGFLDELRVLAQNGLQYAKGDYGYLEEVREWHRNHKELALAALDCRQARYGECQEEA